VVPFRVLRLGRQPFWWLKDPISGREGRRHIRRGDLHIVIDDEGHERYQFVADHPSQFWLADLTDRPV